MGKITDQTQTPHLDVAACIRETGACWGRRGEHHKLGGASHTHPSSPKGRTLNAVTVDPFAPSKGRKNAQRSTAVFAYPTCMKLSLVT